MATTGAATGGFELCDVVHVHASQHSGPSYVVSVIDPLYHNSE